MLHTPVSIPDMVEHGFAISPGSEAFFAVKPAYIHADAAIHTIGYEKRGCYIDGERKLAFYKHYTFINCYMECAANFTFQVILHLYFH